MTWYWAAWSVLSIANAVLIFASWRFVQQAKAINAATRQRATERAIR